MSLIRHPNLRDFGKLGQLFGLLANDRSIEQFLTGEVEKSDIIKGVECEDLYWEDWDEDGPNGGTVDPSVDTTLVYELYEDGWTPKLRKANRKFNELCERFLSLYAAGFPNKSRPVLKRESLEALHDFLREKFWGEVPEELDGELFVDTYDDMRYECADREAERRDPYGYRGLSRRDFMASDRSRLIRLASTMTVGTLERKAILKGLSKQADLVGDMEAEFDSILAGHDANIDAATEFGMRSAHKSASVSITDQQYNSLRPGNKVYMDLSTGYGSTGGEREFVVGRTTYSKKYDVYSKTLYPVGEDGNPIKRGRAKYTLFKRESGVSLGHGGMGTVIKSFRTATTRRRG